MSKKKLPSRIENIFAGLEREAIIPELAEPAIPVTAEHPAGWHFQCNAQGYYMECSPEVQDSLGLEAALFRGQFIDNFQLSPDSPSVGEALLVASLEKRRTVDIEVAFLDVSGARIPARLLMRRLFPAEGEMDDETGWQGEAQVIQEIERTTRLEKKVTKPLPHEPAPPSIPAKPSKKREKKVEAAENLPSAPQYSWTGLDQSGFQSLPAPVESETLSVPFRLEENQWGVLEVVKESPERVWNEDERRLVEQVTDQLSLALENARLFQETQAALQATDTLYKGSAAINSSSSYSDILWALQSHTHIGQAADAMLICLFRSGESGKEALKRVEILTEWSAHPHLTHPQDYRVSELSSLSVLLQQGELVDIADFRQDGRLDNSARSFLQTNFPASQQLLVPLIAARQSIGFIQCLFDQAHHFQEDEFRQIASLANQAGVAILNLRSLEFAEQRALEAQERSSQLALLNRVVSAMISSPDLRQVLEAVANELIQVFTLGHVSIALLDELGLNLTIVAEKSKVDSPEMVGYKLLVKGNQAIEQVIVSRAPVVVKDAQLNPLISPMHNLMRLREVETIAIFPLITGGKVIGTVSLDLLEKDRDFTSTELDLAQTLVGQISTSIQNSSLYEQTQRALAETAMLYQASSELNMARSPAEIIDVLRKFTILRHASLVSINMFDTPWVGEEIPEWLIPFAAWIEDPAAEQRLKTRYPMRSWKTARYLMRSDVPTLIEDTLNDPLVDETVRDFVLEQMAAHSLLIAPLIVGGQWIGNVIAAYREKTRFTEQDTRPMMAITGQAAVSIQNLRLLVESNRRANQVETAAEIARDTSGTLALDKLLNRSVNLIRDRYGYYHASIFLIDESGENAAIRESAGEAGAEMIRRGHMLAVGSQSVIGNVTDRGEPLVINDVSQDSIYRPNLLLPETRAELAIPMKISNRIIGALDVQSQQTEAFQPGDVAALQVLADQIAVAIDNARSYELIQQAVAETRMRFQELTSLHESSEALNSASLEVTEVARVVTRNLMRYMGADEVCVSLYDSSDDTLEIASDIVKIQKAKNPEGKEAWEETDRTGSREPLSNYPATARSMQNLHPIIIQRSDPLADPAELRLMEANRDETLAIIPLVLKNKSIGVIKLEIRGHERTFDEGQLNLLMTMANAAAVSLENARLYQEQLEVADKLRELDKLKSQFLANMSHELRTPLNSIIGFSRVIMKGIDGPVSEMQTQDLTAIHNAGQHLLALINDVLDISKIEAGKMELAFDNNVNIADLIVSAMSTAVGLTKDKPIKLERVVPADLPLVRADPTRVRQVLINFLANAAKFTTEGFIRVEAGTCKDPAGKPELMVSVTDSGIGIAKEDQSKLFQPFSQVDASPTRKVGGTGLGLSISRLLIEMHGGRIGLESETGKGSKFYFTLPLPYVEEENPVETGRQQILVIDDDKMVINLYRRYLESYGYTIVPVIDPTQAVEVARKIKPFAITLDIFMPNLDGWGVLQALKNDPETQVIPVIICSIAEEREKGYSLGAVDYLLKPILEEDLTRSLAQLNKDGFIHEVLVIDDDARDLNNVKEILAKRTSYRVRTALGGPEGLVAVQTNPPQVILLDLQMPELDGFGILEAVKQDQALRDIPVIIFSSPGLSTDQQTRLVEFSHNIMSKEGLQEDELIARLEKALQRIDPTFKKKE